MVLVGRDATVDGSVLAAHNLELSGTEVALIEKHGRVRHEPGDEFSFSTGLSIPQTEETSAWMVLRIKRSLDSNAVAVNEHQVALAGGLNLMSDRKPRAIEVDPPVRRGVTGWARNIALLHARTAREAAGNLGELYTRHGNAYQCGVGFADSNEAWYIESGGGRTWAAVRVPDDAYWVQANGYRIGVIDPADTDNVMTSPNLLEFAEEQGLWNPEDGPFSFRGAFGENTRGRKYNEVREWRAMNLLSPSLNLDARATEFSMTAEPDRKITLEDLFSVLRDREPLAEVVVNREGDTAQVVIGSDRVIHSDVIQLRAELPVALGAVMWSALGVPRGSIYLPFYYGVESLPDAYTLGTPRERAAHFAYKELNRALGTDRVLADSRVKELRALERSVMRDQAKVEAGLLELIESDPVAGARSLTEHVQRVAAEALAMARTTVTTLRRGQ